MSESHVELQSFDDGGLEEKEEPASKSHAIFALLENNKWEDVDALLEGKDKQEVQGWVDSEGWTVLHYAAKMGRLELLGRLVDDFEIDLDIKDGQSCTPLYRAVGFGQQDAMAYLVRRGASLTHINVNGDNLLHNSAYAGDNVFSMMLIKGGHCDPFLFDKWNGMGIMDAITKMPDVAIAVFDSRITEVFRHVRNRLMKYDFTGLEFGHDIDEIQTPIEKMVSEERVELLKHPLIDAWFQVRWDAFARKMLFCQIGIYMLDLAILSSFAVVQKYQEENPKDKALLTSTFVLAMLLLIECLRNSLGEFQEWRSYKKGKANILGYDVVVSKYWFDPWNWADNMTYCCGIASSVIAIVNYSLYSANETPSGASQRATANLLQVGVVLFWAKFLKLLGVFKTTGPYTRMIARMIMDLVIFSSFFSLFWIGFALCWFIKLPVHDDGMAVGLWEAARMVLFATILGDLGAIEDAADDFISQVLLVMMLLLMPLMMANLLIAMMSNSYGIVVYQARDEWRMVWVRFILAAEKEKKLADREKLITEEGVKNLLNVPEENYTSFDVNEARKGNKFDSQSWYIWRDSTHKDEEDDQETNINILKDDLTGQLSSLRSEILAHMADIAKKN